MWHQGRKAALSVLPALPPLVRVGVYKQRHNMIATLDQIIEFAPPQDVPRLMSTFMDRLNVRLELYQHDPVFLIRHSYGRTFTGTLSASILLTTATDAWHVGWSMTWQCEWGIRLWSLHWNSKRNILRRCV